MPAGPVIGPLCRNDQSEGASQQGHHALGVSHLVFGDFGILLVDATSAWSRGSRQAISCSLFSLIRARTSSRS